MLLSLLLLTTCFGVKRHHQVLVHLCRIYKLFTAYLVSIFDAFGIPLRLHLPIVVGFFS
jgi:hypothetical protein